MIQVKQKIFHLLTEHISFYRSGDRLWYEEETGGLTRDQVDQVKKTSLARVLCDNSDDVSVIQPRVFHVPDVENRRVPCEDIPEIDLSLWKEK